jgi:hypothetical protein
MRYDLTDLELISFECYTFSELEWFCDAVDCMINDYSDSEIEYLKEVVINQSRWILEQ